MSLEIDGDGRILGLLPDGLPGTGIPVNGPAFSAYALAQQTPTPATFTKVVMQGEHWNIGGCYDKALSRFTPNVAGIYEVKAAVRAKGTANIATICCIYKNGVEWLRGTQIIGTAAGNFQIVTFSGHVRMNGTTDFIEVYGYVDGSGSVFDVTGAFSWFQAMLVRAD